MESGLIVPIGEWVLKTACEQAAAWLEAGHPKVSVAVNVSARQFHDQDLPTLIQSVLDGCGLPASSLEVELTESEIMADPETAADTLRRLKAHGVALALDDFGTGYSSLGYLKRFAFDRVKLDKSFVDEVISDPNDAAITRAVIALGRTMGLDVLAEGVETAAQLHYLRREGCSQVQGFYFSKPLATEAASRLLAERRAYETGADLEEDHQTVLVIDDEENVGHAVSRVLRRDGYRVLTARTAQEGYEQLATHTVQVVLADYRMPGTTGTEFLGRLQGLYPHVIRILLTGYTDLDTVTEAVNQGWVFRFLTKPWDDADLRRHVRDAFVEYERQSDRSPRRVAT